VAGPGVGIGGTPLPTGEVTKLLIGIGDNPDDTIGFQQAGTERMTIAGGNVGIGTPSPAASLHIAGSAATPGTLQLTPNPAKGTAQSHVHWDTTGDWYIRSANPAGKVVMQDSGGNVGIGTANPTTKLHVAGQVTATQFLGQLVGPKVGFVVDQFVNKLGITLEEGDVVVIGENQASLYYGPNNNVPIPEVDVAQALGDTRVCGVVCEVYAALEAEKKDTSGGKSKAAQTKSTKESSKPTLGRPRTFTAEELQTLDATRVEPNQIGTMVTLGAFAHCKVDADIASIKVGDLLTTSPTKGHAQKVLDPTKAAGAIIGKALGSLKNGKGKIPVLVTLQ